MDGYLNLNCKSLNCNGSLNASTITAANLIVGNEIISGDMELQNLNITNNLGVQGDASIANLEITSTANPFVNVQGSNGQVLTLSNGNLVFTSVGGGSGIQGINTNTPSSLSIVDNSNIVTIDYVGSSGGIQEVNGNSQITAQTNSGVVDLSLNSNLTVDNINAKLNNIVFPSSIGVNNQVLGVQNNQLSFINQASGTIQEVNGNSQITAQTNSGVVDLSLNSNLTVDNVNAKLNNIVYPSSVGANNQVLGVSNGTLTFINQSGGGTYTAGTNIEIANNEISLSNNLNFNNTGSIQLGQTSADNINITESAIILSDKINNTNITIDGNTLSLVNNTGETIAEINPNGVYSVEYVVVNNAGATLYKLPNNISGVTNGEVLAFNGATNALQFVSNGSGGNYTAGTNIEIANNEISLSNNLNFNNTGSIQLGQTSADNVLIQDNNITIKDATNNFVLEMDGNGIVLSDVNTSGTVFEVNTTGVFSQNYHVSNNAGSTLYSLPQTAGANGQVLSMPSSGGTQCVWTNPQGSNYTAGSNISISNNEISLSDTVQIGSSSSQNLQFNNSALLLANNATTSVELNSNGIYSKSFALINSSNDVIYSLPTNSGVEGNLLTVGANSTLIWDNNTITSNTLNVNQAGLDTTIELKNSTTLTATDNNNCNINLINNNVAVGLNQMNINLNAGSLSSDPTKILSATQTDIQAQTAFPSLYLDIGNNNAGLFSFNNNNAQNDQFGQYTNNGVYIRNGLFDCHIDNTNGLLLNFDSGQETQLTSYINNTGAKFAGSVNIDNKYVLPLENGTSGQCVICDGSNQLLFGNPSPLTYNLVLSNNVWTIGVANSPCYLFDGITEATSQIIFNGVGNTRNIKITLPYQLYFGQNAGPYVGQQITNIPIIYWPTDDTTNLTLTRNVGNYICTIASNNATFTDIFDGNYTSNNPNVKLIFSRNTLQDTTFNLEIRILYPQLVYNNLSSTLFYNPMGNDFSGGGENYVLIGFDGVTGSLNLNNLQTFNY